MPRLWLGIFLASASLVVQAAGQESDRDVSVTVERAPVDCHLTIVVAQLPKKICQTRFVYGVQNLGPRTISAEVLCGQGGAESALMKKFHFEVEPQKSASGTVVSTRLSEKEGASSCVLEINGKRTTIFENYQTEWR